MKIIALQAENLKRLVAVEIRPDGNLVQITGKNGQGKTSVLDAIWWALEGARHIQAEPIRKGATKAVIKLDLGEIKVRRTLNAKEDGSYTTSMIAEAADGSRYNKPQDVLDAIVGSLAFDPLAFTRMKPKDQFDALKGFVAGFNFEDVARQRSEAFDKRTTANRRAKDLRAQADGIALPAGQPPAAVDIAALEARLVEAADHNASISVRQNNRAAALGHIQTIDDQIFDLQTKRAEIQNRLDAAEELPEPIDTDALKADLATARQGAAAAADFQRKADLEEQARQAEEDAERLTKKMADLDEAKAKAIQAAEMPISGLGFGEECVTLNGVPFEQGSDAQQLQASIAIASAMNPTLRVIRVRDGSLLDEDAMKALAGFADQYDMQVWIERVDSSGTIGFVLEDGYLKGAPRPAPSAEEAEEAF